MVKETGLPKNWADRNICMVFGHFGSSVQMGQGDGMLHQLLHR